MAAGTRGKLADESDKVFEDAKQSIIDSVQESISTQLQGIKDLISKEPTGVDPCLTVLEKLVVSDDKSLQKTVAAINSDITLLKASESSVDKLQALEFEHRLNNLCDVVGLLEARVNSHESRILANAADHLANNVKIGSLGQLPNEDPVLVVTAFFENILDLKPSAGDIVEASRMKGELWRKVQGGFVTLPKLMFVKCSPSFRGKIEKCKHLLYNKFDETSQMRYSIRPHLPEAHYAVRQKFNEKVKSIIKDNESKEENEKVKFHFRGVDFFIDGFKIVDKINPPRLHTICQLSLDERKTLDLFTFFVSDPKIERCSKFQVFAITVYGPEFINKAYLKMRMDHLSATHVCLAYKYKEEGLNSPTLHGACHDGEYLADIRLQDTLLKDQLNNVAVFVVHRYGGVHIGGKRLTLIQQTAHDALDQLREACGEVLSEPESSADELDAESTVSSQPAHSSQVPDGELDPPQKVMQTPSEKQ